MNLRKPVIAAVSLFFLNVPAILTPAMRAQQPSSTWSQTDSLRILKEVQKKLSSLPSYAVFDWITFGEQGKTIVVKGYASRPQLKSEVDDALKGIAGVEKVDNQIEVLPFSPNDDRVRAAVYNRVFTQPSLSKYNANAGTLARAMGPGGRNAARMAGGITNDPPMGFHGIHIIVKNGNVTLFGVVLNQSDSVFANMAANQAPGAFSVDNSLIVQGSSAKK